MLNYQRVDDVSPIPGFHLSCWGFPWALIFRWNAGSGKRSGKRSVRSWRRFSEGLGGGSLEAINKIDRPRIIINHLYIYILIIMLIMFDDCDI